MKKFNRVLEDKEDRIVGKKGNLMVLKRKENGIFGRVKVG